MHWRRKNVTHSYCHAITMSHQNSVTPLPLKMNMLLQMAFMSCCMIALRALILYIFVYWLNMSSNGSFVIGFIITLRAIVLNPLMNRLNMLRQAAFQCCFIITLRALILYIFMDRPNMLPQVAFLKYEGYLTPI